MLLTLAMFPNTHHRRPARSTGPPLFIGDPGTPAPGVATARTRNRPRPQYNTRSYRATNGVIHILAVNNGARWSDTYGNKANN